MAGIIEVKDQGKLRIYDADNSHYIDIVVPSSVTANRTITIPDASFTVPQADTNTVYTHPNHSGEVTSTADGATVIANNIVDEANLKVSNAPTNGYMLTAQSGNTGGMTWAAAGGGKVLQVVSTTKTDVFTASATDTWHDVTGLTATITPSATSSKILVSGHVMGSSQNSGTDRRFYVLLLRGTTVVGQGDASSNRLRVHNNGYSYGGANNATVPINFLDAPSSTSALTYKIQVRDDTNGVRVNAAPGDADSNTYPRAVSTITLMEVAG